MVDQKELKELVRLAHEHFLYRADEVCTEDCLEFCEVLSDAAQFGIDVLPRAKTEELPAYVERIIRPAVNSLFEILNYRRKTHGAQWILTRPCAAYYLSGVAGIVTDAVEHQDERLCLNIVERFIDPYKADYRNGLYLFVDYTLTP